MLKPDECCRKASSRQRLDDPPGRGTIEAEPTRFDRGGQAIETGPGQSIKVRTRNQVGRIYIVRRRK